MLITTSLIVAMSVTVVVPCHNVSTSICRYPTKPSANCGDASTRYSYDHELAKCVPYQYGGCGGKSQNSFKTIDACNKVCPELSAVCPENYQEVGDTCYEFHHEELVNYTTAASLCKNNGGGYLAMLEDAEERKLFNEFIQEQTYLHVKVKCPDMDVVFIFDTSSSNSECAKGQTGACDRCAQKYEENDRTQRKRSIENTADSTTDPKAKIQVAAVDAAGEATVIIPLNDTKNFRGILNDIPPFFRGCGQTPSKALDKTRTEVFAPGNGAQDSSHRVVVFILEQPWSFDREKLRVAAQKIKEVNVTLITVFVNNDPEIDPMAYFNVSSDPKAQNTFHVENISKLPNIVSTLVTTSCKDLIKMWIGRSEDLGPTVTEGVMTTMNAQFTSELRPKEECYRFVCEADKVWTEK